MKAERLLRTAIFLLLMGGSLFAQADPPRLGGPLVDGSVIRTSGCGVHFFIAFGSTVSLAEWLGGAPVRDSEILQTTDPVTSFEREGRMTVKNLATGRMVDLFIDKALMSPAEFARTVAQTCH